MDERPCYADLLSLSDTFLFPIEGFPINEFAQMDEIFLSTGLIYYDLKLKDQNKGVTHGRCYLTSLELSSISSNTDDLSTNFLSAWVTEISRRRGRSPCPIPAIKDESGLHECVAERKEDSQSACLFAESVELLQELGQRGEI